jgi:LAO/AO transport system kinase
MYSMEAKQDNHRDDIIRKIKEGLSHRDSPTELAEKLQTADLAALSQAITLIESTREDEFDAAATLLRTILPLSGKSIRIGITGVPGAGKSTFIEAFGTFLIERGHKVAVLAVDPSSESGKGSILGDKTRMTELSANPNAFVRPSPNSGIHGGVARRTRESIFLCEAAGFDTILIETVGVGQSETSVKSMVDVFLLIAIAGAGDELQGIKRGIMEMADIVVVNKADGDNLPRAKAARQDIQRALHLFPALTSGWTPASLICSSIEKTGLDEILETINQWRLLTQRNDYFNQQRTSQSNFWLQESIIERLKAEFFKSPEVIAKMAELQNQIANQRISVSEASVRLIEIFKRSV